MRTQKRIFLMLGACVMALAGLTGCGPGESDADVIKVGEVAALTGGTADFGKSSNEGTKMAVEEVNAAGGVLGKKIKLITEDDQSKQGEAGTVAQKLVSRDKVVAMLGEVASGRSLEMGPICQSAGIPMISPASTNPKVTEVGDFVFRVCFLDPFQGAAIAKFVLDNNQKKVAIMTDVKQDYSTGLTQYFKEYFTKNGGQVVSEQSYSSGEKDFRAPLTAIKAAAPEAIIVTGYYQEAGLIVRQAREQGLTVPLLGGDGWDSPALTEVAGKGIEGCFFSNHFSADDTTPHIQEFVKKYSDKYGHPPNAMAALGYDSTMILLDAMKRAGSTEGKALRDAIAATKDFNGVTGKITLDAGRNATKPAVILEIKGGKFLVAKSIAPSDL